MSQPHLLHRLLSRFLPLLAAGLASTWAQPVDVAACLPDKQLSYLQELLNTAMTQSPQMLQRNIELAKADASLAMAQSQQWPSLSGSSRLESGSVSTTGSSRYTSSGFFYDLGLSYSLFKWGDVKNAIEIERIQKLITQKNYASAYRDLAASLRVQFMQLILKKRALQSRTFMLEAMKVQHAENLQKAKTGSISSGDVAMSELGLSEAQLGYDREANDYAAAKRTLARAAGLSALNEARIPLELPAPAFIEGQAENLAKQFGQSDGPSKTPTAQINQYLIRQSELRYKLASARLLPKFEAKAATRLDNVTYLNGTDLRQNATRQHLVQLAANWSIFDGFYTRAAKQSALADKRSAEMNNETYLRNLEEQMNALVAQVGFSARALSMAERRFEWARGGLAYTEEESKKGRMSEGQVVQSKFSLMDNEQRAMSARADLYARWSDLVSTLWMDPALERVPAAYLNR